MVVFYRLLNKALRIKNIDLLFLFRFFYTWFRKWIKKIFARCYHSYSVVVMRKNNLDSSLKWLNKSLQIKLQAFKSDDPTMAENYNSIQIAYRKKGKFRSSNQNVWKIINNLEKCVRCWLSTSPKYHRNLGTAHMNIAIMLIDLLKIMTWRCNMQILLSKSFKNLYLLYIKQIDGFFRILVSSIENKASYKNLYHI